MKEHHSSGSSSESGSGLGKPGTRPQCCCCCWCGRFPVRSKNTFALAHFGPQPPVLFGSTTGMGENHIQLSNRDCGMPRCFFNQAPRLLHTFSLTWLPPCPLLCWIHACSTLIVQFLGCFQLQYLLLPNCLDIFKKKYIQRNRFRDFYLLITSLRANKMLHSSQRKHSLKTEDAAK